MLAAGMLSQPVSVFAEEPVVSESAVLASSGTEADDQDTTGNEKVNNGSESGGPGPTDPAGSKDSTSEGTGGGSGTGENPGGGSGNSGTNSGATTGSGSGTGENPGGGSSNSGTNSGATTGSGSGTGGNPGGGSSNSGTNSGTTTGGGSGTTGTEGGGSSSGGSSGSGSVNPQTPAPDPNAWKAAEEEAARKEAEAEAAEKAAEEEAAGKAAEEEAAKQAAEEKEKEKEAADDPSDDIERVLIGTGSRVVTKPDLEPSFRFWTVAKNKAFTKREDSILEDKSDDAREVGSIHNMGVVYILKDAGDGWLYVESGDARGFIRAENLYLDEEADNIEKAILDSAGAKTDEAKAKFDWSSREAEATVPVYDNKAYTYTHTTTKATVVDKLYFMVDSNVDDYLNVREEQSLDGRLIGKLDPGAIGYIIDDPGDSDWVYIESGEVRGFVARRYLRRDNLLQTEIADKIGKSVPGAGSGGQSVEAAEAVYKTAKAVVDPSENKALYYTLTSVKEGNTGNYIGQQLVSYASQYIGNPYVWGGTSLTDGCDCSGFTQSIYRQFGISLPRVADDQAQVGTAIALEDAAPGDLVFYRDAGGYIYHVAIYAGEGRTVEAANPTKGIVSGYVDSSQVAWCVRLLDLGADIETDGSGTEISPAESTIGGVCSYERWDRENVTVDWIGGTSQKALRDLYENYDTEGFGRIGDRYVVACTDTFGQVGDLIDFKLADGTVVKTIMGDAKDQSDPGCNEWGHENGANVLEFMVNGKLWGYSHANPGTDECHPEFGQQVVSAVNYGSILD